MKKQVKACEFMENSNFYYNCAEFRGFNDWECLDYTKSGKHIKFARLETKIGMYIRQINAYLKPDDIITIIIPD